MTPDEVYAYLEELGCDLPENPTELAQVYHDVNMILDAARTLQAHVAATLAERMKDKRLEVPGLGVFERRTSVSRKSWDHPRLLAVVAKEALDKRVVDEQTGELQEAPDEAIVRVIHKAAAINYWRVGELRQMGLDPDTYCDTEYGAPGIKFTKGA